MMPRSRSRSPRQNSHRCSVALTEEQATQVQATKIVPCAWFGDGSSVPVKNSLESAVEAFMTATKNSLDNMCGPSMALLFHLPLPLFHEWIHEGKMRACPWVNGYRIRGDIDFADVDPGFTLHPFR